MKTTFEPQDIDALADRIAGKVIEVLRGGIESSGDREDKIMRRRMKRRSY